jgi:hypothetical protein
MATADSKVVIDGNCRKCEEGNILVVGSTLPSACRQCPRAIKAQKKKDAE